MDVVIVNCFDTYEHRVALLCDAFIKEGHNVEVLTSDYRHFEKVQRSDQKDNFRLFHAKPYKKNLSYSRLSSHVQLSKDIFKYLGRRETPDLLWVLLPPNSFAKDAAKYKKTHESVRLIFDLIDLWPETMPVGSIKNFFPFTIWRNLRDNNIKVADHIVTECVLYQERLKDVIHGMPTTTLYLARPLVPYEPHLNLPNDRVNLCYLGSINNIIDIDEIGKIIEEIKKCKSVELHIVGDGERKEELVKVSEKAGASVVFHGKVFDRKEKQKIFDSCHYGLNIMKNSVCVGLTMKSMDYLEFGLPMLNNIHGDTWENIEKEKVGINIDTEIVLEEPYDDKSRNRARRYFENELTMEVFDRKVKALLNEIHF